MHGLKPLLSYIIVATVQIAYEGKEIEYAKLILSINQSGFSFLDGSKLDRMNKVLDLMRSMSDGKEKQKAQLVYGGGEMY